MDNKMNCGLTFSSHGSNRNVTCIKILSGGSEIALYDEWYIIIFHTLVCQASVKRLLLIRSVKVHREFENNNVTSKNNDIFVKL